MENFKKLTKQPLFLPIFCMILVLLINLVKSPAFFSIKIQDGVLFGRIIDILNRGSEIAILAVGQTLVVAVSAGTDISVGSVMSLSACSCCMLLAGYGNSSVTTLMVPMGVGMLFGIFMGGVCGAFNGALVSKLKIQPMVATLILFTAGRSIAAWINENRLPVINDPTFAYYGNYIPGVILPTPVFIALICVAVIFLILKFTNLGLYSQAVGINPHSSRLNGINPAVIKLITYVLLGACVAVAGFIKVSRISSINYSVVAKDIEMDAILAVALGGNPLGGGKFNMAASILGAYVIQFLTTTLFKYNVDSTALPAYKAVVVIILVVLSAPVVREKINRFARNIKVKKAVKEA